MKTTLIPPSITPGPWTINDLEIESYFPSIQFGSDPSDHLIINRAPGKPDEYGYTHTTEESVRALAKLIAAAPAMADVLAEFLKNNPSCHESYDMEDAPQEGCDCRTCVFTRKVVAALLAAGYTESTDPLPQN